MTPQEYLLERVGKVVLNSDKIYNQGAKLIAHNPFWKDLLEAICAESWDSLIRFCTRNKNASHTASVKLTFASDLIGKRIAKIIEVDYTDIKNTLALGDLLLESFLQDNLIAIEREYEGYKAPYIVRVLDLPTSIKPILIGTSFEPLPPITNLISGFNKEPFIKGWTNNNFFKQQLDKPFIRALENIRSTCWSLNTEVLEVLKKNPPKTSLELVDRHGEIFTIDVTNKLLDKYPKLKHLDGTTFLGKQDPKLQKLSSKYYEYNSVVEKANLVVANGNKFYQEVSCDYRGRMYYTESFLEFQGSDIARSLFMFHDKQRVTPDGYRWLLIHAANSYNKSYNLDELKQLTYLSTNYVEYLGKEGLDTISLDKMTTEDQVRWAIQNIGFLLERGSKRTLDEEAEKPYAYLAVCIEIYNYHKSKILRTEYFSGLPIPIDGSNNGKPKYLPL